MRYEDSTSLVLDIIGELPPPVKENVPEYKALQVFNHKTGCELAIFTNPETFADAKKAVARKGQSSILRQQAPGGGRLQ
ncbi:MAG: hypothetical protein VW879_06405 [Opitutae bacterium]